MRGKIVKNYKFLSKLFWCFFSFSFIPFMNVFALEINYPSMGDGGSLNSSSSLPAYIEYIYEAGIYLGFGIVIISFAWAGLLWALSPISPSLKAEAKDRFTGSISGLLLLLCSYLIITTINPNLKVLSFNKIPEQNVQSVELERPGGIYLNDGKFPYTASIADLGNLKNRIKNFEIVDTGGSYMAIFYDNTNLWGKCEYVNYSGGAIPWAASMSVHSYDFEANGDGVYFFRKTCFNKIESQYNNKTSLINICKQKSDGYLKISNGDIGELYSAKLFDLEFEEVPEDQKECIKYDKYNKCTERETPTLAGENISSIVINGNYIVLLVYASPDDSGSGPWTFCQEFPTLNDANNMGSYQTKWEAIRNTSGTGASKDEVTGAVLPNYVIIVPIK